MDFDSFYREQLPSLRSYFKRHTHAQPAIIQDLIQDVFVKFVKHPPERTPDQYLFCIAKTVLADYGCRCKKIRETQDEVESCDYDFQHCEEIDQQAEQFGALACLSQKDQNLLHMRFVEGKTVQECADLLRKSPRAIHYRIERCLREARNNFGTHPYPHLFEAAYKRIDDLHLTGDFISQLRNLTSAPLTSTAPP